MPAAENHSKCQDAILFVPGLLGSELTDEDGRTVWGVSTALFARMLGSRRGRSALAASLRRPEPLRAPRLVAGPALLPTIGAVEPYADIVRRLAKISDAVDVYPYDWRLSIANAASGLAEVAEKHLERWRADPRAPADARIILVCHSMGGLVARYFTDVLGGAAIVRQILTLGTPYFGAAKAALALGNGRVLPAGVFGDAVRDLVRSLPAIYELLPRYRCVEGTGLLTPAMVAGIGADLGLAESAAEVHARLAVPSGVPIRAQVGVAQPTWQSLEIAAGEVRGRRHVDGEDRRGDGTVYRDAAAPAGVTPAYLPQRHARLARSPEGLAWVESVLTERPLGPPMGDEIGVDLPEVVVAGEPAEITVQAARPAVCYVTDASTGAPARTVPARPGTDGQVVRLVLNRPGVYRVEVKAGGHSAVGDLLLVLEPGNPD